MNIIWCVISFESYLNSAPMRISSIIHAVAIAKKLFHEESGG